MEFIFEVSYDSHDEQLLFPIAAPVYFCNGHVVFFLIMKVTNKMQLYRLIYYS
jgi:hypothetical protein